MQIREFSKPVTSKQINESLSQKFGYKLQLEQFTDMQLEDARNKLRTRISQMELSESFDSILESPQYQKTRLMLDCINQEIMERADVEKCDDCGKPVEKCECDDHDHEHEEDKKVHNHTKTESYIANTVRQRAMAHSVPTSWINKTIEQINLGEGVDLEELKAELSLRYDLNESQASWILLEGEEDRAETIIATKDMVDRITSWLEDVAAMKSEQLLELLDSIRETQGSDVAQRYNETIKPALESVYSALEQSREGLSNALAVVSGKEVSTMGASTPGMGGAPAAPADLGTGASELTPPIGGAPGEEELPPPAAEVGREKRESVDYSRRLGMLLASKKK
jgi:hypothetical protein